jgi:hypothetical protein
MMLRLVSLFALAVSCTSCSAAAWQGVAAGLQSAGDGVSGAQPSSAVKLMVFGGQGHKQYLGCLNCSSYANDSLFNQFGTHGNKFASDSLLNSFGQFGSRFSSYSACNPFASDPPVIVDQNGNFYGRLTVNEYHHQRTRDQSIQAFIAGVCAG